LVLTLLGFAKLLSLLPRPEIFEDGVRRILRALSAR